MMKRTEIIEFWGLENLTRCPKATVDRLRLTSSSKSFLAEVGLPSPKNDPLWPYQFELQTLTRAPNRSSWFYISLKPRPICIDEGQAGRVIMPSIEGDMERFVNSTVEQLGAFLTVCQSHQKTLLRVEGDNKQSRLIVTTLKEKMREMDLQALQDENAYWAVVLEDMWYPLMTDEELQQLEET